MQAPLQDEEIARRFFDALARGADDEMLPLLAEQVIAFPRIGAPDPVIRGREAVVARVQLLHGDGIDLRFSSVETVKPGYVLTTGFAAFDGSGYDVHVLLHVRDGCIRLLETHTSREQALATVGH